MEHNVEIRGPFSTSRSRSGWSRILLATTALLLALAPAAQAQVRIGGEAPDFSAKGVDGETWTLDSFAEADVLVVCFVSTACPVTKSYDERFIEFVRRYEDRQVAFLGLSCSNTTDSLEALKKRAEEAEFNFPYAFDETGQAARDFGARVTPHLFVFNSARRLVYQGAFDDAEEEPTTPYLVQTVEALLAGEPVPRETTRAFGCPIRLKAVSGERREVRESGD